MWDGAKVNWWVNGERGGLRIYLWRVVLELCINGSRLRMSELDGFKSTDLRFLVLLVGLAADISYRDKGREEGGKEGEVERRKEERRLRNGTGCCRYPRALLFCLVLLHS